VCLPACGPDFTGFMANPCGPGGCQASPRPCADVPTSAFHWSLRGFGPADILDPNLRNQAELTALMHVGDVKRLSLSAASILASENCASKAATVEWMISNRVVARLQGAENPREATLVALQPGDTVVSAMVGFEDGTPPLRVFPWSFTNVGSGDVTVVRVVP
jgi:hypothetical protein